MAKFCKYCGTPLEEGQVCSCPASQANAQPVQQAAPQAPVYQAPVYQAPQAAPQASAYQAAPGAPVAAPAAPAAPAGPSLFKQFTELLLSALKTPAQAQQALLANPKKTPLACMMAAVLAIAVFGFIWALLGQFGDLVGSLVGMTGSVDLDLIMPIFPMLLTGIAVAVVVLGLSAASLLVSGKLVKRNLAFMDGLAISAVDTVLPAAALLVGAILGLVDLRLQLLMLIAACILWAVNGSDASRDYLGIVASQSLKNRLVQTGIMIVVIAVTMFLGWKLLLWDIGEIAMEAMGQKVTISDMMGGMDDIGDLLGGILG